VVNTVSPQDLHLCFCGAVEIVRAGEFKPKVTPVSPDDPGLKSKLFSQVYENDLSKYQSTGIDTHAGTRH
jgi:hypothetical protein